MRFSWRLTAVFSLFLGVIAVILRMLPGEAFSIGPIVMTPATAVLAAGSIVALLSIGWGGRPAAAGVESLLDESSPWDIRTELIVWGLIGLGALLRFAHLGDYPLNGDEHLFVNSAYADGAADVWAGVLQHHHPPANFYMLHFMERISVDPVWLRMPALIAGLYLIWISARFGREIIGPMGGILMAFFVTFSPATLELSRVCRNYTPALAMMVTALTFCVRYTRERKTSDIVLFSLFECLAILWLYSVAITLFAANVVLFGSMVFERRRIVEWVKPFVIQLPVAALLFILYLTHIRVVSSTEMSAHSLIYHNDAIFESARDFVVYLPLPLTLLFQYLFAGITGLIFFVVAIAGSRKLWISGQRSIVMVSFIVVGLAYGLRFAGLLPFTGNRQSIFVFPYLFALVAAGVPSLLRGFSDLRVSGNRPHEARDGSYPVSGMFKPMGMLAGAAALLLFANMALGVQEGTVFIDRQEELPTTYTDLERSVSVLKSKVGPNDLILVSYQGLCAYQAYLNQAAMPYAPARATTIEADGLTFHYSPESGWFFTPDSLVRSYFDALKTEDTGKPDYVWAVRGSGWPWEMPIRDWFHHEFPDVRIDDSVVLASDGWVLRAEADGFEPLGPSVAEIEHYYAEDFIRSQVPHEFRRAPDYFLKRN